MLASRELPSILDEPPVLEPAPAPERLVPLALSVAAILGILTGLAESALLAFARDALHRLTHVNPQALWMAPVTYTAVFALLAVPFALFGRRRPRGHWLAALVAVLGFLSAFSVILLATGLYLWARAAVAAGVAARLATLAPRHRRLLDRLAPRVAGALALLVLLLGAGYNAVAWGREHRALASLPASRAGAPNVLLLIWDTVRASSLGLYGYPRPTTPFLLELATRGVTFDQAFSTAPWTLPSHAGIFTGRWAHELSAGWRTPLNGRWPTLAEALENDGYATAGFVANTHYTAAESGLARGMAHFEDFGLTPGDFLMSTALGRVISYGRPLRNLIGSYEIPGRKTAPRLDADFLRWLDRRPAGRPFFAFLNYYDAHVPYLPPEPYLARFRTQDPARRNPLIWEGWKMKPAEVRAELDAYDASIAYLDAQLRVLTDSLRARGLLDNTILVVTSDHGEEFGEHGVFTHGNSLYVPALHVPLLVVAPGAPRGLRVDAPVSLRELPATILHLAGARSARSLPGESLARFWTAPAGAADEPLIAEVGHATGLPARYPVSVGDMRSVFAGGYHLIRNADGREELYDLRRDPLETRDLAPAARAPAKTPGR